MQPDERYSMDQLSRPAPGYRKKSRAPMVAALVVGTLALTGAGVFVGLSLRGKDAPAGTPAAAAATVTAAEQPSTPPADGPKTAAIGQEITWPDGLKATAFSWKQPVAKGAPKPSEAGAPDNYVWGALDVQVCTGRQATLSSQPWYLRYADNTTLTPSDTGYSQFPKPEYIWGERDVAAGSCTRGWITFAVPAGARPTTVVYSVEDARSAQWTVR
jgi:hypothetical protein